MAKHLFIIWTWLFFLIFIPKGSLLGADLSDSQKKDIVYQLYNSYKEDLPGVKEIGSKELMGLLKNKKVVLIDVREPAEIEVSALPGAVTRDKYLKDVDRYKGLVAVAYCTIGYRSGKFAKEMAAKGLDVKNMAGGLLGWVYEGRRVYHEKKEVKRIHVYGPKWDYPPSGYESVMFSSFERLF